MWSFESEQLESPDVVDPKPVPVPTPVAPVPTQDVGGKAPTVTPAKDTGNKPSTASTPLQDMGGTSLVDIESILINSVCSASRCCPAGGQILRLYPQRKSSAIKFLFLEKPYSLTTYTSRFQISDDNAWRYTLIFTSRDIADQWWRAVSTSSVALLQKNIQRITPQFYTHDPTQWNICFFYTDPRIASLADQFRGKFFMVLENDRGGRGVSIIPTQSVVDHTSGSW